MSLNRIEEKIDKLTETSARMEVHIENNTEDLKYHIKRTNIIESKLQKIVYLLLIGAGIGLSLYGPEVFKLLGILL